MSQQRKQKSMSRNQNKTDASAARVTVKLINRISSREGRLAEFLHDMVCDEDHDNEFEKHVDIQENFLPEAREIIVGLLSREEWK